MQSIGAPIAPEIVAAIERELSVSLAERDTEVASARSDSQLLLSELTEARRIIARLAESLGPAKSQQILGESSTGPSPSIQPMPLTSDTLRRHNNTNAKPPLVRGKPTVLSRRHDPLRVYDRSYVVALEKELLDTREELDDLKTAIDETEATISTLKTKFPHLQSANINLGSKSKPQIDGDEPPIGAAAHDDDDAASATLEAFVVWRATMAQDDTQAAALQRPMPAIDSFAAAEAAAPALVAIAAPAQLETGNDSDSDDQPPPPQDGDASMRFVPLVAVPRPTPGSPVLPVASPALDSPLVAPAKPKRSVNPPPATTAASGGAAAVTAAIAVIPATTDPGSPSSPRPTPPPPRVAQPTPAVPPKSPPVSPRVPRSSKPLPQLPPKSRASTTQHPNAPAPVDDDKPPSERHDDDSESNSTRVSQRQAKPLPEMSSPDLELARQAARKPLPVAGGQHAAPAVVAAATAVASMPVAKKPPMPTVARPAMRVNTAVAAAGSPGPPSPVSPTKRPAVAVPATLTLPGIPGLPGLPGLQPHQPGVYDVVPTPSEMQAVLEAAPDVSEYGKIPHFNDEQQVPDQEQSIDAESDPPAE